MELTTDSVANLCVINDMLKWTTLECALSNKHFETAAILLRRNKSAPSIVELWKIAYTDNTELFKILLETCECQCIEADRYRLLSEFHSELIMKNVNIPEVQHLIEKSILELQYKWECNGGTASTPQNANTSDDQRIADIYKCIELIFDGNDSYLNSFESDNQLLFLVRNISKQIFLISQKKFRSIQKNFPLEEMVYCLNIFLLVHQQPEEYMLYRLLIDKQQIFMYLAKFYDVIHYSNAMQCKSILNCYLEISNNNVGLDMSDVKKAELYWKLQNLGVNYSNNQKFHKIIKSELKNLSETQFEAIKDKVTKNLAKCKNKKSDLVKEKIELYMKNCFNKDKLKFKKMLECYFETTYPEYNRKPFEKFIGDTSLRPISSPFDELIFKLYSLLHNKLFSADEIFEIKMNVTNYMDLSTKIKNFQGKFSEKKLKKKFFQLKQWYSVNRIVYYIEAVEDLDMSQPNLTRALAIQRTMHVIGEFIKATEETKNISKPMEGIIEELGPKHLINFSKSIRNNLSHDYSPNRTALMDEIYEDDLLSDLKCMKSLFVDVLRLEKTKLIRSFFNTILQYKNVSQFQSLFNYVEHVVLDINEISDQINETFLTISKEFFERVIPSLKEDNQEQMVTKKEIIKLMIPFCLDAYQVNFFVFNFKQIQKLLEFPRDINKIQSQIKAYIKNSIFVIDKYRFKYKIFYNNISMYLQQLDTFQAKDLIRKIGNSFMFLNSLKKIKNSLDQEDNVMTSMYAKEHIDEIFSDLKLTDIEGIPGYKTEREKLNKQILPYFENIFEIENKFNALKSFFDNLKVMVDPELLQDFRAKGEDQMQGMLVHKLLKGKALIEEYRIGPEGKSKVKLFAIEMLMMEVTVILSSQKIFTENRFILDEMVPVLNGLNLRNYFAHGNVAYKVLLPHSSYQFNEIIFLNAMHLYQMQLKLYHRSTVDRCLSNSLVKPNFDNSFIMIQQQNELFVAIRTLNTEMLNNCLQNGAEIRGVMSGRENVFEVFLSEHFELHSIFKAKKEILNGDKLKFLTKFIPMIPNNIQKEGIANCKLFENHFIRNIHSKTQELIQRGKYETIETSVLHKACSIGAIETVRLICQNKFNINRLNKGSETPLIVASAHGYTDIIKILLNYGAKVEVNKDKSILHAVANNDLESLELLFSKWSNRNMKWTINLYDILHVAVICNCDLSIIKFLISNGSSILSTDISLNTILHQAAYYGNTNIIRYLLKEDLVSTEYNVNDSKIFLYSNNYYKNTPLMAVAESGQLVVLKLLMQKFSQALEEQNIDISVMLRIALSRYNLVVANELAKKYMHLMKDNTIQNSILNYAIERQAVTMIKLLLKRGFVIDTKSSILLVTSTLNAETFSVIFEEYKKDNEFGINSELDYRGQKVRLITMALHQSNIEILKILIKSGADVHYRNELTKSSILHDYFLSHSGTVELLDYLIACNCDLNARNVEGSTPLHAAVLYDHLKKLNILLEKGALVTVTDNIGQTPLHVACLFGHYNCVIILKNFGAHINAIDSFKRTPLHYACLFGQNKCQEILIRYGADETMRDASNYLPSDYCRIFIKTCQILNINCSKGKTKNNDFIKGLRKILTRFYLAPEQSIDIDKISKQMFSEEML